ncbi:hypothetical protein [Natrinema sp. 1APR25-10V2]|uniref:hypothetical protein n=1 Tax=Natrinema sp. 1APR25-10V2 TaxID=2951081 RepID=UPI002875D0F3|nr:hypothetical protein [Natrinema sp. 1APR25-10V2]MDS0475240.1 hypothetical protein [Natrinema sp. 1APR25-10V2]
MQEESAGRLERSSSLRDHPELTAVSVLVAVIAVVSAQYVVTELLAIDASNAFLVGAFAGLVIAQFVRYLCQWYGVE